jgi:hypothetical protein
MMISSCSYDCKMTAFSVMIFWVLSIFLIPLIEPLSATQNVRQYSQSVSPPATLTYTTVGSLRGSIQGLLEDLSNIASPTNAEVSGKIASSGINLNNGNVEKVLYGNWSLNAQQSNSSILRVNFDVMNYSNGVPRKNSPVESFTIGNLTVNSMQQSNGNTEIGGSVDVSQQEGQRQQHTWNDVGARLSLEYNVFVLTLDDASEPGQIFAHSPIIGFITPTT